MSDKLRIVTNNQPRLVLNYDQLTAKEQKKFEYLSPEEKLSSDFVRYRGVVYDLGDFINCPREDMCNPQMREAGFHKWDAYQDDSFFSGVLCRWAEDYGYVVMATYIG